MIAKIEVLPGGTLPTKAHATDAAWDCHAREVEEVAIGVYRCALGFRIELHPGWFADMRPRSSIWKWRCWLSNSCGVVDAGYRGEVQAYFYAMPGASVIPPAVGNRVVQMMIRKLDDVELVQVAAVADNTPRGVGGFGSTGR
jgi:deoxyuridine 5'-triphosphate nucleotidohydrolase